MIETPAEILTHEASKDAVDGFIDWRKTLKKPLTVRAAGLVSKTLREITASGGDADEALDMTQERGWLTVKSAWYWNAKRQEAPQMKVINGGRHDQAKNLQAIGRTHATTRAINVAGAARRTPQGDCF